ncbi:MAG: hypothetical protein AB8G99_06360 [Planctomycetaceae bacterium]
MQSSKQQPSVQLQPIPAMALIAIACFTVVMSASWYFFTDHSVKETLALISAAALACGIGLLGLRAVGSLGLSSRRPH